MNAPDLIEPTIGWRSWFVVETDDGPRLGATIQRRFVWPAREAAEASCLVRFSDHADSAPEIDCRCGIHAADDLNYALSYVGPFAWNGSGAPILWIAYGKTRLWGHVVEHGRGWRAQYAYPAQILLPGTWRDRREPDVNDLAEQLRDAYDVPVYVVHARKRRMLDRIRRR